jgi:MOSC domain-containing protein YiiM
METTIQHQTTEQLTEALPFLRAAPRDHGVLKAIVIRPASNERISLQHVEISPEGGVHGDRWSQKCWKTLPDGRPHPDVQVTLMNARMTDLIAGDDSRWALAGDNFYVDLDLSHDNLKPGDQLAIGTALLEVTAVPHNGCKKFAQRFGNDAVRFVNTPMGKSLHLRGIYAKIVQAGVVTVGDTVHKH